VRQFGLGPGDGPSGEDWRGPVSGARWIRGASITDWMPGPLSPLFETAFVPQAEVVMQDLCRELRLRLPRPFLAVIGGRLYLRGDSYLRPGLFLVPFTYFRFALRLERRWRAEWLPELRATSERWERDLEDLEDGDLLRGIDELARAGARYWRAAYLPRFAGFSEQLFTVYYSLIATNDDPHLAVLLGGTADVDGAIAARTAPHLDFVNPTAAELGAPTRAPFPSSAREDAAAAGARVNKRLGPVRRWLFGVLWRWARHWASLREESMLYMGYAWPPLRRVVAEWERRHGLEEGLAYFLRRDELNSSPDAATAVERRAQWRRRRRTPAPLMLPAPFRMLGLSMERYLAGGQAKGDEDLVRGVGVSPGVVSGRACVLFSPVDAHRMQPGGVLVAPLTNPAWTPLMASAVAIVTDTGGPLSHASIVAREFGVPAVVGTGDATWLLEHGTHITVDGNNGTVTRAPQQ
jgi:phosphohistidine swiveling domain-containing protein